MCPRHGFNHALTHPGPALQAGERLREGHARVPVADVFVEVEFGESRDDEHLGGEVGEELRHTGDQFGELEAGEGAGNLNLSVELLKRDAALARQSFEQPWVRAVGPVEKEHALSLEQEARQEIVAESGRLAMKNRQPVRRQRPGLG
jgi:hypothetical protein